MWDFSVCEQFTTCFSNAFGQKLTNQRGYPLVVDGFRRFTHALSQISQICCQRIKNCASDVVRFDGDPWKYCKICDVYVNFVAHMDIQSGQIWCGFSEKVINIYHFHSVYDKCMTHFITESRPNVDFDQNPSLKCMMSVSHFVKESRQNAKYTTIFFTPCNIFMSIDPH